MFKILLDKFPNLIDLLNLSYERLLIGILLLGLGTTVYLLTIQKSSYEVNERNYKNFSEHRVDSLNKVIVKLDLDCNKDKLDITKEYYIQSEKTYKEYYQQLNAVKQQHIKILQNESN